MSERVVRHVIVHGRVQGVGYRAWTEHIAGKIGLDGWVRNRRDGTVEALFAGRAEAVGRMLDACRRGPPSSSVERIDEREADAGELALGMPGERFSVLPTL